MQHPLIGRDDDAVALIDAGSGASVTYRELHALLDRRADELRDLAGGVVMLGASSTIATVVDYLTLTAIDATVALLDPASPSSVVEGWRRAYHPDFLSGFANAPASFARASGQPRAREWVLLPTSGSTGNPKFVRLSADNVVANARQIVEALRIERTDRALGHLPLFYSYGLSVLNSHLLAGASVVLTTDGGLRPEFWKTMRVYRVSSLAGVPYSYEIYRRAGLLDMDLPYLRRMTQAGGRLAPERVAEFHAALAARNVELWIMYGQTEAAARIAVLPPEELPDAMGSVGYAVPQGHLAIEGPDARGDGEVVYSGPNVMLGYASSRADLGGIDEMKGVLRTGDLGHIDGRGRLVITGRLKRVAKVFGARVSLDDVEAQLRSFGTVAAIDDGDRVAVFIESGAPVDGLARRMERALAFPPRSVVVYGVETLPTTAAGKIDYQQLRGA